MKKNQHTPTQSIGVQCSMFRIVCSIRWLQSALIPFVTTQSVADKRAEKRQLLNPPHESTTPIKALGIKPSAQIKKSAKAQVFTVIWATEEKKFCFYI